jgi:hypothetical protein
VDRAAGWQQLQPLPQAFPWQRRPIDEGTDDTAAKGRDYFDAENIASPWDV